MKKTMIILTAAISLLTACSDKKKTTTADNSSSVKEETGLTVNEGEGKTGSFSVNGTSFNGKSSTQYFGDKVTGQFSVLCQQDEPFALLQAVFNNEKSASGNLKPAGSSYSVAPGDAHIALSGTAIGDKEFTTGSGSTGSITAGDHTLVLKDLKLFNSDKQEKTVSATIAY
ncbi:MAG TPA: hypothetical protein VGO58_13745 [Chitinophagaceae bacterium]|jgi:hypothetical protein|nr:hypothetical protein [Chitinophagaceae bacterium]